MSNYSKISINLNMSVDGSNLDVKRSFGLRVAPVAMLNMLHYAKKKLKLKILNLIQLRDGVVLTPKLSKVSGTRVRSGFNFFSCSHMQTIESYQQTTKPTQLFIVVII